MYKVFVNDILIIFSDKLVEFEQEKDSLILESIFELGEYAQEIIYRLRAQNKKNILVKTDVLDFEWHRFKSVFYHVNASGGLGIDKDSNLLFIKRNQVWDLPKGHVEDGEEFEEAALREVKEECGRLDLKIESFLLTTYHIYFFMDQWRLKSTHWYKMRVGNVYELIPQSEEGIEEVRFLVSDDLEWLKEQTYPNILSVLESAGIRI